MQKSNRILSFLLTLVMVLTILPATVFAASETDVLEGWSITLGDDIGVKFYLDSADYAVTATVNGEAVTPAISGNVATVNVAAAQMTDEIVVTISDGDTVLTQKSYTVCDYIKTLIEGNYDEKLQALAKAALNYGAGAQVYFDHHADTLANAGYETTETVAIPEINTDNMVSGEVSGIRFYGASLVYNSKIAVRFYFDVTGDISNYTFSIGNEPVLKDGLYYVEIDGINPQDYAKETALTVSDGSQEMTVTYSPMYYIGRMYNKTDKITDLVKAGRLKEVEYVRDAIDREFDLA